MKSQLVATSARQKLHCRGSVVLGNAIISIGSTAISKYICTDVLIVIVVNYGVLHLFIVDCVLVFHRFYRSVTD